MSQGLTTEDARQKLAQYGPNSIPERRPGLLKRFLKWLLSPITLMLLAAAALSWAGRHDFDLGLILFLTVLNGFITFFQEQRADQAVDQLKSQLTVSVRTMRDGQWQMVPASQLVPDDLVELTVGAVVPADAKILQASNLSANEAALTGESLPKQKAVGDSVLSGSYVTTGLGQAIVTKTGTRTAYGKTIVLVEGSNKRSLLEQEILNIAYLLSVTSLIGVALLTVVFLAQHQPIAELLRLDLSLVIAGIPVSLPTVMSIIIGIGIIELSRRKVIVRQMSALENLANINLLLSDKTGTLTQNAISVAAQRTYAEATPEEVLALAAAVATVEQDPINHALRQAAANNKVAHDIKVTETVPADSQRKRNTGYLIVDGHKITISVGAMQVIGPLCRSDKRRLARMESDTAAAAADGYRVLAVAQANGHKETEMELLGIILLSDPPREEAASTIRFLRREGIEVKMLTGDNHAIARRIAQQLGLIGKMVPAGELKADPPSGKAWWRDKAGFAEILPEDKFKLVESAKRDFVVAATGDGVNDLPALTSADIGMAVSNAVDALKSSADIVLTAPGIAVIKEALVESRKIFERLYSYSVYRISESLRLIVTITVLGLTIRAYPVTPIQLILIAFLNDLPIISLAFNHVKMTDAPAVSKSKRKLYRGMLHGSVGIASSLLFFYLMRSVFNMPLDVTQTAFFLKLTVAGHMLIYVAHTDEPWYRFLPSRQVIAATAITQLLATVVAGSGLFMARLPIGWIAVVWVWSFGWMQVSDMAKALIPKK